MRRSRVATGVLVTAALVLGAGAAAAQEIQITGPLSGACVALGVHYSTPAKAEWAYWVAGGASLTHTARGGDWRPTGGVGAEITWEAARYVGFPAIVRGSDDSFADLRVGPWIYAATRGTGALVEGGATLHWGAYRPQWAFGTFGLRLGGGYGTLDYATTPHVAATLTYGFESVPARYSFGGVCDPPIVPKRIAENAFGRFFVTHRRMLDANEGWEIAFGVEITPTALFRPLWRLFREKE